MSEHEQDAVPLDAGHARPQPLAWLDLSVAKVPVFALQELDDGDIRRVSSFVTNFGNWELPPAEAAAVGSNVCHLEWIHDTGELMLFGGVPHVAAASVDVPASFGAGAQALASPMFGDATGYGRSPIPGCVRQSFLEEQLPWDSRVALITRIEHGPRVHEVLWGWHAHHRDKDGWTWLTARLGEFGDLGGEDLRLL